MAKPKETKGNVAPSFRISHLETESTKQAHVRLVEISNCALVGKSTLKEILMQIQRISNKAIFH